MNSKVTHFNSALKKVQEWALWISERRKSQAEAKAMKYKNNKDVQRTALCVPVKQVKRK